MSFGLFIPAVYGKNVNQHYTIGVEDEIKINILQPEQFETSSAVAPDGSISFPYIGRVHVKGLTLQQVQDKIEDQLADGYMKYPVVSVSLGESRSRKFFVYGEVVKPGSYPMGENITVLRAISMAGGFTEFGSSSKVKVLRPRGNSPGYNIIKVNIKSILDGQVEADIIINPGDMIVVSESIF